MRKRKRIRCGGGLVASRPTLCVPGSQRDGLRVDGHGIVDIVAVAARHGNGNRYAPLIREIEDFLVAPGQALQRQFEPSEPIALVRIRAGQIDHQLRLEAPSQDVECAGQRLQIVFVAAAIVQADVQVRRLLAERVVFLAVQRQGENGGVIAQNRRRAVALMYIQINDGDPKIRRRPA